MDVLRIDSITKKFGSFYAVENLSFNVPAGIVYGLLGPNGAGKTTTIRMVMNIIIPDKGRIAVLGEAMDEKMKERVGYLPEERGLYPKMKVFDLLLFLAEIKGLKAGWAKKEIDLWLERFDLTEWKQKKVETLSKGMQQKIQFIATILHQPELIILDEPFGGLDPVNTKLLKDIMLEMKEKGTSIIFSTHRMEQVEMICDNICLINKGRPVLEGNLSRIKREYGRNTVLLYYEGNGSFIKNLPEVAHFDDYGKFMEIKLKKKEDSQSLLLKCAAKVTVNRFEIKEPTLNSIFIEKVGEQNEKNIGGH
ncbi:MAG: ATP-binding cassette domain-containing protein [Candidatus Aminicenantes bacterium]|nr:ATP-binding cassette domain-containing protein [Candidatus Aminicenantes bacterium]